MKVLLLSLGVLLVAGVLAVPMAYAETRSPPEATAHAIDELANALAQGKITFTPTPSPTSTPSPTATATPAPLDTPVPMATATLAATPAPGLPVPAADAEPLGAYVRRSSFADPGPWLELALPQGRWDIVESDGCRDRLAPWTDVGLSSLSDGRPELVDVDHDQARACEVLRASWHSDVPCATNDDGRCDVLMDAAYWDALGRQQALEAEATPEPIAAATPLPARAAAPLTAPAPQQAQVVIQTVVVTTTPTDVVELEATPVAAATTVPATPVPTAAPSPFATSTVIPIAVVEVFVQPTATAAPSSTVAPQEASVGRWDWGVFLQAVAGVVLAVACAVWLLTRRRVVVWRPSKGAPDARP